MTKDEAINEIEMAISIIKQDGKDWLDVRDIPWLEMAIESLKQNQWVPCSERLPIKDDCVFVYLFGDSPYIAWHDGVDWCTEDFTVDKDEEPIAWMPLPKPYKGK